jgi:hypothetical protein
MLLINKKHNFYMNKSPDKSLLDQEGLMTAEDAASMVAGLAKLSNSSEQAYIGDKNTRLRLAGVMTLEDQIVAGVAGKVGDKGHQLAIEAVASVEAWEEGRKNS